MNKPYAFLLSGTFRCLSLCMVALNITTVCLGRQVLRVPEREPLADQFGTSIAFAGDINGDGRGDVIAGAIRRGAEGPGYAALISGADGSVLRTLVGGTPGTYFGIAVAGGADLTGNGNPDVLVGAFNWKARTRGEFSGMVSAYEGATGELLFTLHAPEGCGQFGRSVCLLGDVDGDGKSEVVVAAPSMDVASEDALGAVLVYSGATQQLMYRVNGRLARDSFAASVLAIPDVNADGHPDLLIGSPRGGSSPADVGGYVTCVSGANGSELFAIASNERGAGIGASLGGGLDADGDSLPDFVVGRVSSMGLGAGGVQLYSGSTKQPLQGLIGASAGFRPGRDVALLKVGTQTGQLALVMSDQETGQIRRSNLDGSVAHSRVLAGVQTAGGLRICPLPDLDADGVDDIAVGCPWATSPATPQGACVGQVLILSGATLSTLHSIYGGALGN